MLRKDLWWSYIGIRSIFSLHQLVMKRMLFYSVLLFVYLAFHTKFQVFNKGLSRVVTLEQKISPSPWSYKKLQHRGKCPFLSLLFNCSFNLFLQEAIGLIEPLMNDPVNYVRQVSYFVSKVNNNYLHSKSIPYSSSTSVLIYSPYTCYKLMLFLFCHEMSTGFIFRRIW